MLCLNKVFITGRLTKDAEETETKGIKIQRFTMAVRGLKKQNGEYDSYFINCVAFNPPSFIKDNMKKGTSILVEGSIQTSSYEVNGDKRHSTNVVVNRMEILSKTEQKQDGTQQVLDNSHIKTEVQQQFEYSDEDYPF